MKTRSLIYILFILISTCLINSCKSHKGEEKKTAEEHEHLAENMVELTQEQANLAGIKLGAISSGVVSGVVKANGILTVSPHNLASICAPMGGFVKSTDLVTGSPVKKGQVLAVIENQEFINLQQNYFESKSRFEFAEAEYKRHSELYKDDVYSAKNLQQVTTDYKILKAQVHALEQKLHMIGLDPSTMKEDNITSLVPVLSPITGFIKSVNVNTGKYLTPTDVMFEIINSDQLLLELNLFEKDIDKVAPGQRIKFFINNEPEVHHAMINQIGKSVSTDKTCKVYASVTEVCKNMMQGMYVNAQIESSEKTVASLPSQAIVGFDDKDYIFVFERQKTENGKPVNEYKMVEVKKGATMDGVTEVILPIEINPLNLQIVIEGAYNLLSAQKNAGEMSC